MGRGRVGWSRGVDGGGRGVTRGTSSKGMCWGTRTAFVFHEIGGLGNAVRVDWVLHDYALRDSSDEAPFVRCRVFHKHLAGTRTCQGVVNLNGEPSALATSHRDSQIDRNICLIPAGGDINNTIHSNSVVSVELNFHINNGPTAPDVEPLGLGRLPEIILCAGLDADDSANHEIISITEEDFLELTDLADPLLGNAG